MTSKCFKTINAPILAEKLLAWSLKKNSINICGFCAEFGVTKDALKKNIVKNQKLAYAYEITCMRLADRREKMANSNDVHIKCWERYQKMYDPFLNDFENEESKRKASLDKEILESNLLNLTELRKNQHLIPKDEDFTQT